MFRVLSLCFSLLSVVVMTACGGDTSPTPQSYPAPGTRAPVATADAAAYPAPAKPTQSPPTVAAMTAQSAAKRETKNVSFNTGDNVKIAGMLYTPDSARAPAVLMLHMAYASRKDWDAFAQRLQGAGFVVLAIDFRGHGESGGAMDWEKMTQDAAAAWKFLNSQPNVDTKRIVVVGASIGSNVALSFAAAEPNVKAVGLLSPGLDYFNIKTDGAIKTYGKRPVLIFSSSEDSYSADTQKALEPLASGPKQVQLFQNVGHGTDMLRDGKVAEALFAWIKSVTT
jgi:dienelactone hydrolase